ncbi:MAG: class I SAM-dependent methyltransferase [Nocardioides sp.]
MSGSGLTTAKRTYVRGVRVVGRGLTAMRVIDTEPPPREQRTRHWLHSLTRVHDTGALVDLDVPWWTYRAVDEIEVWLSALPRPARVFEYGAGASTVWLARRSGEVVSVEHDPGFAVAMEALLSTVPNATMLLRPPTPSGRPAVPSAKEGYAGLDFASYVAAIDEVSGDFDLVVIDGRAREASLERALPRLADGGIVVFDNTRRRRYRRAIEAAPVVERRLRGLTPTLPYPEQTSVLRPA